MLVRLLLLTLSRFLGALSKYGLHNLVLEGTHIDYNTTLKFDMAGRHKWRGYLNSMPNGSPLITWIKFFEVFLDMYMPNSVRDYLRDQILRL